MDFRERKEAFYNRFGLPVEKTDEMLLQIEFRNSILNYIDDVDHALDASDIIIFCGRFGIRAEFTQTLQGRTGSNIKKLFIKQPDFIKFLFQIESLLNFGFCESKRLFKDSFFNNIKEVFKNSELPINMVLSKNQCVIYPEGCKFLDQKLIVGTLKFLHSAAHDHFISALKDYSSSNYIKSAEQTRRSFEEFLRYKLSNKKGLEKNILELTKFYKEACPTEIRNIISKVANCIDKLFNEHSKHNDGQINENECEYLIYQVAVLMRYIDKISD